MGSALNTVSALANLADREKEGKGGGSTASNVTNIYITIPPHTAMTSPGTATTPGGPWTTFDPNRPNYAGGASWSPYTAPGAHSPMGPYGVYDQSTGQWRDNMQQPLGGSGGGVTYDPRTGTVSGDRNSNGLGWTPAGPVFMFSDQQRRR